MSDRRVLVTGATGFIGRQSLASLVELGYEVHGAYVGPPLDEMRDVAWHEVDLLDESAARKLLAGVRPTHLLHFAWHAAPGEYWTSPLNLDWVRASLFLLREFANQGGRRVVGVGTCAEYDWGCGLCSEATTPLAPATLYGACKRSLGLIMEQFTGAVGISAAWGRVFFLYGPHEHPSRLVPSVVGSILDGKPAECSHGNQVRDYMYVRDVGEAFAALLDSETQGAVNIASGAPVRIKDIVLKIGRKLGRQDLVALGARPAPASEPMSLTADVARLRSEVGWSPSYDLDRGIEETIEWFRRQRAG